MYEAITGSGDSKAANTNSRPSIVLVHTVVWVTAVLQCCTGPLVKDCGLTVL